MKLETREYLLKRSNSSAESWLDVEDVGSNFEMRVRTVQQTFDMLNNAYGFESSAKETLSVHLEGTAAKLAGIDKSLESVQASVRNLFAEAPFNIELKLTGIEPGSTILVYEPAESDVRTESVLGDEQVEVTASQASRAAKDALEFLGRIEEHNAQLDWNDALRRAHLLSQDLSKLGLEAEFAWRAYNGSTSFARFTHNSADYLGHLDQILEDTVQEVRVQGLITEISLAAEGLYKVTVRTSLSTRAPKTAVLINNEAFRRLGAFIGDFVSWTAKKTVWIDGFGRQADKRVEFIAVCADQSELELFSVEDEF